MKVWYIWHDCNYKIVVGRDGTLPGGEYYVSSVKKQITKLVLTNLERGPTNYTNTFQQTEPSK